MLGIAVGTEGGEIVRYNPGDHLSGDGAAGGLQVPPMYTVEFFEGSNTTPDDYWPGVGSRKRFALTFPWMFRVSAAIRDSCAWTRASRRCCTKGGRANDSPL